MFNCIVFKYKIEVNGFLRKKKNRFYFREELENLIANFRIFFFVIFIYLGSNVWHVGILVTWPGIEPVLPALEVWGLNHWTFMEAQKECFLKKKKSKNILGREAIYDLQTYRKF